MKALLFNAHKSGGRGQRQKGNVHSGKILSNTKKKRSKSKHPILSTLACIISIPASHPCDYLLHELEGGIALRDISDRSTSLAELKELLGGQLGLNDGSVVILGTVGKVHNIRLSTALQLLPIDSTNIQIRLGTTDHLPVVEAIAQAAEGPVAKTHVVAATAVLLVADGAAVGPGVAAALEVPVARDGAEGAAGEEEARVDAAAGVGVPAAADVAAAAGVAAA